MNFFDQCADLLEYIYDNRLFTHMTNPTQRYSNGYRGSHLFFNTDGSLLAVHRIKSSQPITDCFRIIDGHLVFETPLNPLEAKHLVALTREELNEFIRSFSS
jgi:hypothetical protein